MKNNEKDEIKKGGRQCEEGEEREGVEGWTEPCDLP